MPIIDKIFYEVITPVHIDYTAAPPRAYESDEFSLSLQSSELVVTMKGDLSEEDALTRVGTFLRSWEIQIGLIVSPNAIVFKLKRVEYRGSEKRSSNYIRVPADMIVSERRDRFPDLLTGFRTSPEVEVLYQRYKNHGEGKEPLQAMAYYCLSYIGAGSRNGRGAAANKYSMDLEVLNTLGDLTSEGGDPSEARKAGGKRGTAPLSDREKNWVLEAVRVLIRRVGEMAFDPQGKWPMVQMSDLPLLA